MDLSASIAALAAAFTSSGVGWSQMPWPRFTPPTSMQRRDILRMSDWVRPWTRRASLRLMEARGYRSAEPRVVACASRDRASRPAARPVGPRPQGGDAAAARGGGHAHRRRRAPHRAAAAGHAAGRVDPRALLGLGRLPGPRAARLHQRLLAQLSAGLPAAG